MRSLTGGRRARQGDRVSATAEVLRGETVESLHRANVAVAHAEKGIVASAGDPWMVSFVRSAIKMFQALPLTEDGGVDRFGLSAEELALCAASHGGEPAHVEAALSILRRAGASEEALACGPHPPSHAPSAEALRSRGEAPRRIHNNCSGKHAGMLALCRLHGWPTEDYHTRSHPSQTRVLATLGRWARVEPGDISVAIDGCGLPTFAMPLSAVAGACARFAAAAMDGDPAPARVFNAMTAHPYFVAGTGRLCTELMNVGGGRLFAKVGAEGYYCAGVPAARLGVAIKVADGAWRAVEPVLLAVLRALDVLDDRDLERLCSFAQPAILNTRGETVGRIRARVSLDSPR